MTFESTRSCSKGGVPLWSVLCGNCFRSAPPTASTPLSIHVIGNRHRYLAHISPISRYTSSSSHPPLAMFRLALKTASRSAAARATAPIASSSFRQSAAPSILSLSRSYASGGGLGKDEISGRIMEVLKSFEKVDGGKVRLVTPPAPVGRMSQSSSNG
jgi:hypothetical protein